MKFLLGLTCSQNKSKFFSEYTCALGGGDPYNLNRIDFKIKNSKRPANESDVRFVSNLGTENECSSLVKMWDLSWNDRNFTPNPCNFCTDTYNELADATFMDAWLPDYNKDYRGHNIVLVRDRTLSNLISQGKEDGNLEICDLSINRVIESQKGVVHSKRNLTPERARLAIRAGYRVPRTREPILSQRLPYSERLLCKATYLNSLKSREEWVPCDKDIRRYQKAMAPCTRALLRAKLLNRIRQRPWLLLGSLWRRLVKKFEE